jgi:arylsulfatase A-like enzyme
VSKNKVMIILDTARAQNFSCYGHDKETTPFIDSIAKKGTKVENCYSNAPWTLPSHYSFFTGLLPSEHGKDRKEAKGPIEQETLPEKLSEKGYKTIAYSNNGYISPLYGFDEIFDEFNFNGDDLEGGDRILFEDDQLFKELKKGEKNGRWDKSKKKYLYFVKESVKRFSPKSWVNVAYYLFSKKKENQFEDKGAEKTLQQIENREFEEPFFVFINFVEPHSPYQPPKEYAKEFLPEEDLDRAYKYGKTNLTKYLSEEEETPDDLSRLLEGLYNAELNYIDDKLRQLKKTLDGKTEETEYIILSDHGEYFGERGLWEHQAMLGEEVLKVPLIFSESKEDIGKRNFFSLKQLFQFILNGKVGDKAEGKTFAEYSGLDSHNWGLDKSKFKEEYFCRQKMSIDDEGEISLSKSNIVNEIDI